MTKKLFVFILFSVLFTVIVIAILGLFVDLNIVDIAGLILAALITGRDKCKRQWNRFQ